MKEGRMSVEFSEEGGECKLPGVLCKYDLLLCGDSEEDMIVVIKKKWFEGRKDWYVRSMWIEGNWSMSV